MKLTELKKTVAFAVKQALLESAFEQYDETMEIPGSMDEISSSLAPEISLEEKINQAARIIADCAQKLARLEASGRVYAFDWESLRDKCVTECVSLFLDKNGDFSDPDVTEYEIEDSLVDVAHQLIGEKDDREIKLVTRLGYRVGHKLRGLNDPSFDDPRPHDSMFESKFHKPNFFSSLK